MHTGLVELYLPVCEVVEMRAIPEIIPQLLELSHPYGVFLSAIGDLQLLLVEFVDVLALFGRNQMFQQSFGVNKGIHARTFLGDCIYLQLSLFDRVLNIFIQHLPENRHLVRKTDACLDKSLGVGLTPADQLKRFDISMRLMNKY